jgi:site-specific DNA-methyltransferase (adenine-specific)
MKIFIQTNADVVYMDINHILSGSEIQYSVQAMTEWSDVNADLAIVDPPFGIEFSGTESNYNRDESQVVEGYVEWDVDGYESKIGTLLEVLYKNLAETGQGLLFSGWNNSNVIHNQILQSNLNLEGKLYWSYNFAPYCQKRPAHNIYEIFWVTKDDSEWFYTNECSFDHCTEGEANLSHLHVKRDYHKNMPKYPTRLPSKLVKIFIEHFSKPNDTIFDPCAGSGMVGVASAEMNRNAVLGDLNKEGVEVFQEIVDLSKN